MIKRFSEDIDFKIQNVRNRLTRNDRRAYRQDIKEFVNQIGFFHVFDEKAHNEGKCFTLSIEYPQQLEHSSLREHLKLEFRLQCPFLETETKEISSFISELTKQNPEIPSVNCVSLLETASEKYSALLWRIFDKDRTKERGSIQNDPTIMRHLHDLCSLETFVCNGPKIKSTIEAVFKKDRKPSHLSENYTLTKLAQEAFTKLTEDKLYAREYDQFVTQVSYAEDNKRINFQSAYSSFENYTKLVLR